MIEVEGLTKYYGRLAAINDVNFRVEQGEIVGFLGPNGAGKTTTMRILTCFTPAHKGNARILGMDVRLDAAAIRSKVGYLPENVPLYGWMRVQSYLRFVARAKGIASSEIENEITSVAQAAGAEPVMGKLIRTLSKGYKQRVGLAQALVGDPPILILDEPTIGLDPKQIREIRELIKSFARNRTVILSTHILPEVSQVCDRVIIINKGTIIAEDTPSNLTKARAKSARNQIEVRAPEQEVSTLLSNIPGVVSVKVDSRDANANGVTRVVVETESDSDKRSDLARAIVEKGWDLLELRSLDASLEDAFIAMVTEEPEEKNAETKSETEENT